MTLTMIPGGKSIEGVLPAHDPFAEDALIGILLLGQVRIRDVADVITTPEIFYSRTTRHLFESITRVDASGRAVDITTVQSDLRDAGRLGDVGGTRDLVERINGVEHGTDVKRARSYAQTIRNRWIQRRLAQTAESIRAQAYQPTRDVGSLVADAAAAVREVERDTVVDASTIGIKECLSELVARAHARTSAIGVRTGFASLDAYLLGLHPKQVTVLGARTSVGKSMLAAQIATSVAEQGLGVLYITLEMSGTNLVLRVLASRARIDTRDILTNNLREEELGRFIAASQSLHQLPIRFNASQSMAMSEVCSCATSYELELAMAGKTIGLVVLDHVGIVKPSAAASKRNREQEVAETSRALRYVAETFQCHVLALAQINRESEKRSGADRMPKLHDLRDCLVGGTMVYNPTTGERITVRELAAGRACDVVAVTPLWKIEPASVTMAWSTGERDVVRVRTRTGRVLRCTTNHPLLTVDGWKPVADIAVGDEIAVPRSLPAPTRPIGGVTPAEARLLGYLISDGSYLEHRSVSYVKADDAVVDDVLAIVESRFGLRGKPKPCVGNARQYEFRMDTTGPNKNPLIQWLKAIGIHGQIGHEKRVPASLFRCRNEVVAEFLGALWAGDGCITGKDSKWTAKFCSTSEGLLFDVQHMLLRLGILSSIGRDIATLFVTEADQLLRFAERIPIVGLKGAKLREMTADIAALGRNSRIDRLPLQVTEQVAVMRTAAGLSWSQLGYRCQGKRIGRERLARVAERMGDVGFSDLANSDILWDSIDSIVPDGREETFDLRVAALHNFVADDICVHNSGSLEQDADNVLLLHRPRDKQNLFIGNVPATLVVAKARISGLLGAISLDVNVAHCRFQDNGGAE